MDMTLGGQPGLRKIYRLGLGEPTYDPKTGTTAYPLQPRRHGSLWHRLIDHRFPWLKRVWGFVVAFWPYRRR